MTLSGFTLVSSLKWKWTVTVTLIVFHVHLAKYQHISKQQISECYDHHTKCITTNGSTIPYIGNHPWKKSIANYLLCHSSRENFHDLCNLIYKIPTEIKSVRKHSQMLPDSRNLQTFFLRTIPIIQYLNLVHTINAAKSSRYFPLLPYNYVTYLFTLFRCIPSSLLDTSNSGIYQLVLLQMTMNRIT